MATRNIIIELQPTPSLVAAFGAPTLDAAPDLGAEIAIDPAFPPTQVPQVTARTPMEVGHQFGAKVDVDMAPEASTYIVRATVEEGTEDAIAARSDVVGVYADVAIQPMQICPGSPPMGSHTDVERLLCTSRLRQAGATGSGVLVAIVDTGVNMNYLNGKGKHPQFDAARSWAPRPAIIPGQGAVGHGTMCAFDVCIAAPNCTLLDIALLASNAQGGTVMEGLLSDAVRAYSHLCTVMAAARRPGENASMVVNNSWGMFHPSWDYPRGHPGNYSHNPNHPFNRIVGALERLGADILFAGGNCGAPCPDGRCQGVTGTIYGANSHPSVLTVAGVDTSKTRVGYSNQGPGALVRDKPDVCGYTHFAGSGVYAADGGTSAATPVVAGLVAAIRSRRPYIAGNASRTPTAIRDLLRSTAQDLGTAGFDLDHGFGVVNGCTIAQRLQPIIVDICRRIPRLCGPRPIPIDICKRYPWICRGIPEDRFPIPEPGPIRRGAPAQGLFGAADDSLAMGDFGEAGLLDTLSTDEVADLFYTLGLADGAGEGRSGSGGDRPAPSKVKAAGCGCGGA